MKRFFDLNFREMVWSHKFKDSVLDIVGTESGEVIVGLADGNISMLKVSVCVCVCVCVCIPTELS